MLHYPGVKRWHCPAHEHLADRATSKRPGEGIKLSPSGVPIPDDPAADAADRDRERSRRAQRKAEAETRAVEAAERRASNEARDAAHQTELPHPLRRSPA